MDFDGISGLEAEITYNGLMLNEQRATAPTGIRYQVTDIGGLDDADVRDAREVNPARDGELALPAFYGGRTITLTGKIIAGNIRELRQMQQDLRTAFGPLYEQPLSFSNSTGESVDVQISARKSAPIQMREIQANQNPTRDFMVTLRASDPRFYSMVTNTATASGALLATTFNAVNGGNANTDPIIKITGPLVSIAGGAFPVFSIANNTSGKTMGFYLPASTMATSASVSIVNSKTRQVSGSLSYSNMMANSIFPEVASGSNTFGVTGLTGTGSVQVIYKSAWI